MTAHQKLCNMAGKMSKVAVAYVTSCCRDEHDSAGSGRRSMAGFRSQVDKL